MPDEIVGPGRERAGVSRRTVMKGAAWSVPVVMVATAAPAMAYSGPIQFSGTACKHSGASDGNDVKQDYHFEFTVTVPSGPCVNVTINSVAIGGVNGFAYCVGAQCASSGGDATTGSVDLGCLSPGSHSYVLHVDDDNSANTSVDIYYTYGGVSGQAQGVTGVSPCTFEPPNY